MSVAVLTLQLTLISAGVRGLLAWASPPDSTPLTRHNWMRRGGALQRGGLDGTGRKMDEGLKCGYRGEKGERGPTGGRQEAGDTATHLRLSSHVSPWALWRRCPDTNLLGQTACEEGRGRMKAGEEAGAIAIQLSICDICASVGREGELVQ
ncbi:unnamed protein product [Pleuronectes platessa]|uniref:Secreted protein n=1 Tax=Pleuronectes platessa TaxID=8262 RepID=A0A9N7VSI3_PLEPL|nr:unnamed protein product [Pleuronectes platessa]